MHSPPWAQWLTRGRVETILLHSSLDHLALWLTLSTKSWSLFHPSCWLDCWDFGGGGGGGCLGERFGPENFRFIPLKILFFTVKCNTQKSAWKYIFTFKDNNINTCVLLPTLRNRTVPPPPNPFVPIPNHISFLPANAPDFCDVQFLAFLLAFIPYVHFSKTILWFCLFWTSYKWNLIVIFFYCFFHSVFSI